MVVGSSPAVEVGGERGRRHPPGPDSSDQHGAPQKLTLAPTRKIRGGSTAMGTPRLVPVTPLVSEGPDVNNLLGKHR